MLVWDKLFMCSQYILLKSLMDNIAGFIRLYYDTLYVVNGIMVYICMSMSIQTYYKRNRFLELMINCRRYMKYEISSKLVFFQFSLPFQKSIQYYKELLKIWVTFFVLDLVRSFSLSCLEHSFDFNASTDIYLLV